MHFIHDFLLDATEKTGKVCSALVVNMINPYHLMRSNSYEKE